MKIIKKKIVAFAITAISLGAFSNAFSLSENTLYNLSYTIESTPKEEFDSIKRSDFLIAKRKAKFGQINNVPKSTPPIVIDKISCVWSYANALGGDLPDGRSSSGSNLDIMPGDGFVLLSDKTQCVRAFDCKIRLKVRGTNTTRDFRKRIKKNQTPSDSCIISVISNVVAGS